MLYLIGIGLGAPEDITFKGIEAIKKSGRVYLELYTSALLYPKTKLEIFLGKKVDAVEREFVASGAQILEEAKTMDVCLLVIGDPLCATTHYSLLQQAREKQVEYAVIHNASIISAVGITGLQVYKFGRTASVPFPKENFEPEGFYDVIKGNKSIGAHTLLLLDIERGRFMSINEAIEIIRCVERKKKQGVFLPKDICIGIARLGFKEQLIVSGTVLELSDFDFGSPPHALIVPGKLHFLEEEAIKESCIKK